jgi:competence protein ComEC
MSKKHFSELFFKTPLSFIEWSPFFLGLGIGLYFIQKGPPSFLTVTLTMLLLGLGIALLCKETLRTSFLLKAFLLTLFGFLMTEGHRALKNTPRKAWRILRPVFNASVEGTVQEIAFHTKRPLVILGPPHMRVSFEKRHGRGEGKKLTFNPRHQGLRILLKKDDPLPSIGDHVGGRFFLQPVQSAVTPHGFDFERYAYFMGMGGSGYALDSLKTLEEAPSGTKIQALRVHIGNRIRRVLPALEASIAVALVIGDRSAIPKNLRDAFVDAGVAHVLAISGLHLTLVTGLFFFIIRRLLCFVPTLALNHDTKKIAALFALLGGFFYLLLSGTSISTQRAFIMMTFMMGALWLDRGSFSKRTVMVAAFIVLMAQPIALFMPSFHLSFFAVMALISMYHHWHHRHVLSSPKTKSLWGRGFSYVQGLLFASFTASLATIPFTIYHFHKFTLQSLAANLLVIPLVSFWIMPFALLALLLMPWGQESFVLKGMGQGIQVMIDVAERVATWPGAVIQVPELPPSSLALMLVGSFLILQGFHRRVGMVVLGISFLPLLWSNPPLIFINEGATRVGVRENEKLWVTTKKPVTFVTRLWSESLGYDIKALHSWPQETETKAFLPLKTLCGVVGYARTVEDAEHLCPKVDLLITRKPVECPTAMMITARDTWRQGPHFIYCKEGKLIVKSSKPFPYVWPWH